MGLKLLVVAVAIAIVGIFFAGDADILLYLAPKEPEKAFQGQTIWIVGASSGIGASLAYDFAQSGAQVIVSARRVEMLQELAANIHEKHPSAPAVHVLPLDVTDYTAHAAAVEAVIAKFSRLDMVVLNAGQSQRNLAADAPFEDTYKVNLPYFFPIMSPSFIYFALHFI